MWKMSVLSDRTTGDEKLSERSHELESTKSAMMLEINKLTAELAEHVVHTDLLNDQVSWCWVIAHSVGFWLINLCWLGDGKGIRPAKKVGCWIVDGDNLTGALHNL